MNTNTSDVKTEIESINAVTLAGQVSGSIEILPSGNGVLTVKTSGKDNWTKTTTVVFHRVMIPKGQVQRYQRMNLTDRDRVLVRGRRKTTFFRKDGATKGYDENVNASTIQLHDGNTDRNDIQLVGRIIRAPHLQFDEEGEPFVRFTLATTEDSEFRSDNRREENWHTVILRGKNKADLFYEAYRNGGAVGIIGRIEYDRKEVKGSKRVYATVLASNYFPVKETVEV